LKCVGGSFGQINKVTKVKIGNNKAGAKMVPYTPGSDENPPPVMFSAVKSEGTLDLLWPLWTMWGEGEDTRPPVDSKACSPTDPNTHIPACPYIHMHTHTHTLRPAHPHTRTPAAP
jgi:hypothetical protein